MNESPSLLRLALRMRSSARREESLSNEELPQPKEEPPQPKEEPSADDIALRDSRALRFVLQRDALHSVRAHLPGSLLHNDETCNFNASPFCLFLHSCKLHASHHTWLCHTQGWMPPGPATPGDSTLCYGHMDPFDFCVCQEGQHPRPPLHAHHHQLHLRHPCPPPPASPASPLSGSHSA